jgi:hypothetical protein
LFPRTTSFATTTSPSSGATVLLRSDRGHSARGTLPPLQKRRGSRRPPRPQPSPEPATRGPPPPALPTERAAKRSAARRSR